MSVHYLALSHEESLRTSVIPVTLLNPPSASLNRPDSKRNRKWRGPSFGLIRPSAKRSSEEHRGPGHAVKAAKKVCVSWDKPLTAENNQSKKTHNHWAFEPEWIAGPRRCLALMHVKAGSKNESSGF
jgi:hypothetical protein